MTLKTRWYLLRSKMALKWPLMTKKEHGKILNSRVSSERTSIRSEVNKEVLELRKIMADVVPKLVRVSMMPDAITPDRFRLILDLDPFLVRESFMWGNDQKALAYFCEYVGHHVLREMKTMNMHRFSSEFPMREHYNPRLRY